MNTPDDSAWKTSSYSGDTSLCVEIALTPHRVWIRDTKNRTRGCLTVSVPAWAAFLDQER